MRHRSILIQVAALNPFHETPHVALDHSPLQQPVQSFNVMLLFVERHFSVTCNVGTMIAPVERRILQVSHREGARCCTVFRTGWINCNGTPSDQRKPHAFKERVLVHDGRTEVSIPDLECLSAKRRPKKTMDLSGKRDHSCRSVRNPTHGLESFIRPLSWSLASLDHEGSKRWRLKVPWRPHRALASAAMDLQVPGT